MHSSPRPTGSQDERAHADLPGFRRGEPRGATGDRPWRSSGRQSTGTSDTRASGRPRRRPCAPGARDSSPKRRHAFIFARAAEEIAALEAAGIAVEIVPGITAAQACAADARLPLTYRGEVRQISFVTGAAGDGEPDLDWPTLARPGQALAIYMGVRTAPRIAGALMAASAKSALPAVIVENGGRPEQRTIATTLGSLSTAIDGHAVRGPAIVFLGLDWRRAWLRVLPGVETFPCPLPAILSRTWPEQLHRPVPHDRPIAPLDLLALSN